MYGKITDIKTIENFKLTKNNWQLMDGYKISTDCTKILVLISNGQSCCENWGYMSSDDDLSQFIGTDLREINLTDTALNKKNVKEFYDAGGVQFVDFVTNKGTFQLAVYNGHNGYYGHSIKVIVGGKVICEDRL